MPRILKLYDYKPAGAPPEGIKVIEPYPAFTLVEASDAASEELKRSHLVEDVTDQYELPVVPGGIDTSIPRINALGKTRPHPAYRAASTLPPGPHHYVIQFIGPIKKSWLAGARKAGADLVEPAGAFSYIARLTSRAVTSVSKLPFVHWLGHLPYRARVSTSLLEAPGERFDPQVPRTRLREGVFTVQFFRPKQATSARSKARKLGFTILDARPDAALLVVKTDEKKAASIAKKIDALSRIHGVSQITERPFRRKSNDRAAAVMGGAATLGNPGLNLSGDGEIIAVADTGLDTGDPQNMHPDFVGRIAFIKSYPITSDFKLLISNFGKNDGPGDVDSGHGTHVAGSVLGDGAGSANLPGLAGRVRGFSHRAKLVFQAVEHEMKWKNPADLRENGRFVLSGIPLNLATLFSDAYQKGARIHSNSWGGGDPGEYDEQCRQVDDFVWKKPDFCILFAAGNDGTDANKDGVVDLGSVTAPGTAKNCITVGACENNRPEFTRTYGQNWPKDYPVEPLKSDRMANDPNDIVAFSSRGPTLDGRIKPDIVAPGSFILSARSRMIAENLFGWARFPASKLYMHEGGTSMATPLTAGAVGATREYLRKQQKIASPSAALLKATLVAGAIYMRGAPFDFDVNQGYGRVNLDGILMPPVPLKSRFIEGAGIDTGAIDERTIQIGSSASSLRVVLAYSDFPGKRLVNNLNLIVRTPSGIFLGNGRQAGTTTFDTSNNVELVHIPQAAAGSYRVQVVGSNVPRGPQPFALVIRGALV